MCEYHFKGDEEKELCVDDWDGGSGCVVMSIGSNDQLEFEEAVFDRTKCRTFTFDCTGDFTVPRASPHSIASDPSQPPQPAYKS